ncbi:MAG TPA: hypothetical protein P5116_02930 [Eubacteriales bacterium]|nr:hypothetical protein [Eubacteriales bacterium]
MKKILALLCCTLLLFGCSPKDDTAFDEMVFAPSDPAALLTDANALLTALDTMGERELTARLQSFSKELDRLYSQLNLAYVLYCMTPDPEHEQAYTELASFTDELEYAYCRLVVAADELYNCCDDAVTDAACAALALRSPQLLPLLAKERVLIADYERISSDFTVFANGRSWSMDEITSDESLSFAEWQTLRELWYSEYNAKVSELFSELAAVRKAQAKVLGFVSYSEYRYELYGRDYTVTEAAQFADLVKSEIVPLYYELVSGRGAELMYLSFGEFTAETTLETFAAAVTEEFPALRFAADSLVSRELYDLSDDPNKLDGCYTTYFGEYDAPFIYMKWDKSYASVSALIHEFGHFSSFCIRGGAYGALDAAETDAQSLPLLLMPAYDALYGRFADSARVDALVSALYSMIAGCLQDEFERAAYELSPVNADALNALYASVCAEYSVPATGVEWVMIPHTFRSPLYYVSYAVSASAALQLLSLSQTNAAAKQAYIELLHRSQTANLSTVFMRLGLENPLSSSAVGKARSGVLLELSKIG